MALYWSLLALTAAMFAFAIHPRVMGPSFEVLLGLRMLGIFTAALLALLCFGGLAPSARVQGWLAAGAVAIECAVTGLTGQVQPMFLILGALGLGVWMSGMREERRVFETTSRPVKPTSRRMRDLLLEIRDGARELREKIENGLKKKSGESENMIAQNSGGLLAQATVAKTQGPNLTLADINEICAQLVQQKRSESQGRKQTQIAFASNSKVNIPVKVMIDAADLQMIVGTCLDYAVSALSGGEGLVRLSMQTGLRQVSITVEDNGFGMSEERLANSKTGRLNFAQMRGLLAFWGARLQRFARLGVGSRVVIELPRVDAFVQESEELISQARNSNQELPLE